MNQYEIPLAVYTQRNDRTMSSSHINKSNTMSTREPHLFPNNPTEKSPIPYKKSPISHETVPYHMKRAMYHITRALDYTKRALHHM